MTLQFSIPKSFYSERSFFQTRKSYMPELIHNNGLVLYKIVFNNYVLLLLDVILKA